MPTGEPRPQEIRLMPDLLTVKDQADEDRFARLRLISWWDQERLSRAKFLVIGAGALGNEILKNLALVGVGNVLVADRDRIENSNLSRSVLFRGEDCGLSKADVAAARAREIYPGMRVQPLTANIVHDLGAGAYRWADVILGGLDNREARVAINHAAARAGKIWIDGAIERLQGVARVFDPACGPCYECTMNETDWKMLQARRSCALLTRDEMEEGKVPTVSTTASVIAGIQCQEAVKLIHGLDVLSGSGFVFEGMTHSSYVVNYTRKHDCPVHEPDEPVCVLPQGIGETRVGDFLERVRGELGREAVIETSGDLLSSLYCPGCGDEEPCLASLGKVDERKGRCPKCGEHRTPNLYHTIDGCEAFIDRTLGELGIPLWDVLAGRCGERQMFYEFAGDRASVLGKIEARSEER
jgi:molybdopterin/thiamine biosynthesis adenylyltransferase